MKKTIYVLLLIIIIASSILIYKIKNTPKYNKELYDEIYKEYSEIQQNDQIYIDDYDMYAVRTVSVGYMLDNSFE